MPAEPASKCGERYQAYLDPAEKMAMTVATAQVRRGDSVPPNTAAMLIIAVERLEHALAHAMDAALECDADNSDG
jgi:hypothetical protein